MKIEMNSMIRQLAVGLDFVEAEFLGAKTNHGKRLYILCSSMAKLCDLSKEEAMTLSMLAPLHDNALTEYIASEFGNDEDAFWKHCEIGQKNIEKLRFPSPIKDIILNHHEHPNGSGAFGKQEGEISLEAQILSLADNIDVHFGLGQMQPEKIEKVLNFVESNKGKLYSHKVADAFIKIFDEKMLASLKDNSIKTTLKNIEEEWYIDLDNKDLINLADFAMKIIDYKSQFTRKHSSQIANRAWLMAKYYNYSIDDAVQLYLAAAFHDLGKLAIKPEILEKEGKLTDNEYAIIKSHVAMTHHLLKDVKGLEKICYWAAAHHEKLDGSGYPFGRNADELDFNARMLTIIDIYQAVSEERPYHPQRSHEDTMKIVFDMANKKQIDEKITADIDIAMKPFSMKDLPKPEI